MWLEAPNYEDLIPQNQWQETQDIQEISSTIEASLDPEWKPDRSVTEAEVNKLGRTFDYMGEKYGEDDPQVQDARWEANDARSDMVSELPGESTKNNLSNLSNEFQIGQVDEKWWDIQEEIKLVELQITKLQESGASRREIYKLNKKRAALMQQVENQAQQVENQAQQVENQAQHEKNLKSKDIYLNKVPNNLASISHLSEIQVFLSEINILKNVPNDDPAALEEAMKNIDNRLGNWSPDTLLYKILLTLKKEDEKNGNTEYFDTFKTSLVDLGFEDKILVFENNYSLDNPGKPKNTNDVIWQAIKPLNSTENTSDGSDTIRTYISQDGSKTEIDTSIFPPKREVSLSGSEYRIETETPMADWLEEVAEEYKETHEKLGLRINSLSNLIETISSISSTSLSAIKDYLLSDSVLTDAFKSNNPDVVDAIQGASSMDDLKGNTLMVLKWLKDKAEKELKDAEDKYQKTLNDQVDSYREMMSEKDNRTKEILKTLQNTGFDMLPQHVSDMLIAEIQSGQLILDIEAPFDPGNIDIANGQFGQSEALSGTDDLFIKNIVRFMNKILGLNPDGTDIDGHLVGLSEESYKIWQAPFTPAELRTKLIDSGILLENGWVDIERARNSLKMDMSESFESIK